MLKQSNQVQKKILSCGMSESPARREKAELRELARGIEGWLGDREGEVLYDLARKCTGRGAIVEIGSWKGKSTIWLAKGSKAGNGVKVYAVDTHTGSSEHRQDAGGVWTFDAFKRN